MPNLNLPTCAIEILKKIDKTPRNAEEMPSNSCAVIKEPELGSVCHYQWKQTSKEQIHIEVLCGYSDLFLYLLKFKSMKVSLVLYSVYTSLWMDIFYLSLIYFTQCDFFFLSIFKEDNNTRVLFERVLTSGSLPPEKSGYVCKSSFTALEKIHNHFQP